MSTSAVSNSVKPPTVLVSVDAIHRAKERLKNVAQVTPLSHIYSLSEKYDCTIRLKREDLQVVRSYKIRGAFNKIATATAKELENGIVCASAGNHAQGVAFACATLDIRGRIYMPKPTPQQKVSKVKNFGKGKIEIVLVGDTFDAAYSEARQYSDEHNSLFVHPFDDDKIIEGQGTVGLEILEQSADPIDILFVPIGGGGLISGVGSYFKQLSPHTRIIGVEPVGAPAMQQSLVRGSVYTLPEIDNFVDGAAVRRVGDRTFEIAREVVEEVALVPEGKVCTTILSLYNEEGIVVEPAGALTIAVLDQYRDQIRGKNVVCILSGSNNDINRTDEIRERSLLYEGLKHYFIIRFPQRSGALRDFLNEVLASTDDITYFEYTRKHSRTTGPALVGILVEKREDFEAILVRMQERKMEFQHLNDNPMLFDLLI